MVLASSLTNGIQADTVLQLYQKPNRQIRRYNLQVCHAGVHVGGVAKECPERTSNFLQRIKNE
jgi:hypothetical protein